MLSRTGCVGIIRNTGSPPQDKQENTKGSLAEPSARRTVAFLKLSRTQARQVTGLLIGHYHLKGHLFKLGIADSPIY
jgi:hypothetical protein